MRLFIKNISREFCTEKDLTELFEKYGTIVDLAIPHYRENDKPRGFAFVEFEDENKAVQARNELDGLDFHERCLGVSEAYPKTSERYGKDED